MADDQSGRSSDQSGSGRLWATFRSLIPFRHHEPSLRDQIEDVIGEHEEDPDHQDEDGDDLTPDERQMVRNVLQFSERDVGDVAVPRSDIIAIDESASFDELVTLFVEAGHSRLPVYRDSLDEVTGMIHIKDVFDIIATNAPRPDAISTLIREPRYVPATMSVHHLLEEMRRTRTHLAIVIDEYSGTDGLVTIEDLVEEIVGEIEDEYDEAPPELIDPISDGVWEVDARAPIDMLADRVDPALGVGEDDVDTVGGLAFMLAGRVPETGETLLHDSGWQFTILAGDDRRVTRVRLSRAVDPVVADPVAVDG